MHQGILFSSYKCLKFLTDPSRHVQLVGSGLKKLPLQRAAVFSTVESDDDN
jgi:hypothetical protein